MQATTSTRAGREPASGAVVWRRQVPEAVRARVALERVDYADVATGEVDTAAGREPEQWAEVMLGGIPAGLRMLIGIVQAHVLRLELHPRRTSEYVMGWKIAERGEGWMRLEAGGPLIEANIVVEAVGGRLSCATFGRYASPLARLLWPPVSLLHRWAAVLLVRAAVRAGPPPA